MKRIFIITITLLSVSLLYYGFTESPSLLHKNNYAWLKDGDILFQDTGGDLGEAIKAATKSKYSHCGMVFKEGDNIIVFEAIGPVKYTPIGEWVSHGKENKFTTYRLKDSKIINLELIKLWKQKASKYMGKAYDHVFGWDDEKIYCSELVWKMYNEVGIKLSNPKQLKEFDLSSRVVQQQLKQRYGTKIPYQEKVVAPQDIVESSVLEEIK